MKTISLKKVSAVAVASLGFGLLSVVPANSAIVAANVSFSKSGASPAATIDAPTTVGTAIVSDLNIITATNAVGNAATTLAITWTLLNPNGTDVTSTATFANTGLSAGVTTSTFASNVDTVTLAATAAAGTRKVGTISFTPAMSGRYTLRAASAASSAGDSVDAIAVADATTPYWYVSGAGAVVAASGVGTTTIGAVSGGIAQIRFATAAKASGAVYNLTSAGVGSIQTVANGTTAPASIAGIAAASDYTQGAKITGSANTDHNDVLATVSSTVAGTQTLTWTAINSTTGIPTVVATQAITWGAAPVLSVGNSKVYISAGDDTTTLSADDTTVYLASTAATTTVANIQVTLNNDANTAFNGQKLTVTVEGPGQFGVDVNSLNGVTADRTNRIYADSSSNAGNTWQIGIAADGTSGTSKFTIKVGDVVVATKSLTFYGSVSAYTATPVLIATADGNATTDAVVVCAVDSNKNAVPGATIYASSGSTSVAAVATTGTTVSSAVLEDLDTGAGSALNPASYQAAKAVGCAGFTVTGVSQTTASSVVLTFRNASTAASSTVTTTATVAVGGVKASSITLTADKASYAAGEKMVLTLTLKDSAGRLIGAGPGVATLDAALKASASLGGDALFGADNATKLGVKTATVYAPLQGGKLTITGETGVAGTYVATSAAGVALSLSPTVSDPNAGLLTQIDALNAKIVALNALIAKIMKKLGVK